MSRGAAVCRALRESTVHRQHLSCDRNNPIGSCHRIDMARRIKGPLSGVPPGRSDGAERTIGFDSIRTNSLPDEGSTSVELPTFSLAITAAEKLPHYSYMISVGGGPIGELLRGEEGHTYFSAQGFDILSERSPDGWIQFSYPNATGPVRGRDRWFRGEPSPGGVELLLWCNKGEEIQYTLCKAFGKVEPVFDDFRFEATGLDKIDEMNDLARRFVSCLLEGF